MKENQVKKLVMAAMCVALGIVLPMAFHTIQNAGSIFLPMHIPVLICGLLCGWQYGLICGILAPVLSSLFTGMPPAAILPAILCELAVYGLITGICVYGIHTEKQIVKIYGSLITAMLAGRIVSGILKALIFNVGEYSFKIFITESRDCRAEKEIVTMDIRTYFNQRAAHWDDGEQSVDQIRRMIAFLSDIQEGMSVLDVACGTGAMFEALRERKPSHITAVDLSEKMIEIAARKVEGDSLFEVQCRDLFEMTQETFDRIIIYNAYPHFMEKDKVVLLNPGGRFIVAHGACKEKINGCHTNVPKEITSGLLSAKEESRLWETCFSIDILIDTEQFYMFSGVK